MDKLALVMAVVVLACVLSWLDRRRRERELVRAGELAVIQGFTHESGTNRTLPVDFELLPVRTIHNVLRDRHRPQDEFGCNLLIRSGRNSLDALAGVARLSTLVPAVVLRRQGMLGAGRRPDLVVGDEEFDERWIVSTPNPEFWRRALGPLLRSWMMTLPGGLSAVQLEVNEDWVLATTSGGEIDRIPEMVEHAKTFALHLARLPQ